MATVLVFSAEPVLAYFQASDMKQNLVTYQKVEPATYTAFVVYSADDGNLNFYNRTEVPSAGDTLEGKAVTAVYTDFTEEPWTDDYQYSIQSVTVVDEGIKPTNLDLWFASCEGLKAVSMAKLGTSAVTSMDGLFDLCELLDTISGLDSWDTSSVTNMGSVFYGCTSLTDISVLAKWSTSALTEAWGMFVECTALTSLAGLQDWDVSAVTSIQGMFQKCTALTDISALEKWDTSSVSEMIEIFDECSSLADISLLAGWDVSAVTSMESVFRKCSSLASVVALANWNTSAVTDTSGMFCFCAIADVSALAGWDVSSVTYMGDSSVDRYGMFSYCGALADASPLAGWNTSKVTCMRGMFYGIKSTAMGNLSSWNVAAVTNHYNFCNASGVTQPNWVS